MDTKKLKEEIKLLERKIELMEQLTELQRMADEYNKKVPIYPLYPTYPVYPQPFYPWERIIYSGGTTTIPCEISTIHNGQATSAGSVCGQAGISDTTVIKDNAQVSYTN